jgi:CheY-like chemotaxis protein
MARVLVVEDDPSTRELLATALEVFGVHVATAANGKDGLECLRRERPCVVLLDLMMPVMDGAAFREAQLADTRLAQIPVLLVTAVHDPDVRAEQLHVNGWIAKPFEIDQVIDAVLSYCGMGGQR